MAAEKHYVKTRCVWPPAVTSKKYGSQVVMVMRSEERIDRVFGKDWQRTEMPSGKVHATDLNVPASAIPNYMSFDLARNPPITVLGKYKAILTARAVQNRNLTPKMIISSPALRCVETAAAIAGYLKVPIGIEPGLSEHPAGTVDCGIPSLGKIFNIDSSYKPVMDSIAAKESKHDVELRVQEVLKSLIKRERSRPLFIVAHGIVQQALCHMANGVPLESDASEMKPLDSVEMGLRFPPGSVLTAVRATDEPPHNYRIINNMIPPLTYGDSFSTAPVPL